MRSDRPISPKGVKTEADLQERGTAWGLWGAQRGDSHVTAHLTPACSGAPTYLWNPRPWAWRSGSNNSHEQIEEEINLFYCCSPFILIKLVVRGKHLPKLHAHLLPTALNDCNWCIKKAKQLTRIHFYIFPWSASSRSWTSLLRKVGDGFIKELTNRKNSCLRTITYEFLTELMEITCLLVSSSLDLPFPPSWHRYNSPLTVFLPSCSLPPLACMIPCP